MMGVSHISVIIPTYNNERFIEQAISSAIGQNYGNMEIIVVDDGSTDQTQRVLAQFGNTIEVIRQPNSGSAAARNTGLEVATGDYVAFLDADDLFLPEKLLKQSEILNRCSHVGAVHSGWTIIDSFGKELKDVEPWHVAPSLDLLTWLTMKPIRLGAMLIRRHWLEQVEGFDASFRQCQDVDLILRLAAKGCRTEWLREMTMCYRHHDASTIRSNALAHVEYAKRVLDKFYSSPDLPRRVRKRKAFIKYYATLWGAWHLFHSELAQHADSSLKDTLKHAPYIRHDTVLDWLAQFVHWTVSNGGARQDVHSMLKVFESSCGMPSEAWRSASADLEWGLNVWAHYSLGQLEEGRAALRKVQIRDANQIVRQTQFYLTFTPLTVDLSTLNHFWSDAKALGHVHRSSEDAVIPLYLGLLGRAVWDGRYRDALRAFVAAIVLSWKPRTWSIWGCVIIKQLRYLVQSETSRADEGRLRWQRQSNTVRRSGSARK